MDCTTCRERLTAALDRQLAPEEIASVEAHLASCAACRRLAGELTSAGSELSRGLSGLAAGAPDPGDLLAGIRARLGGVPEPVPVPVHEVVRSAPASPRPRIRPLPATSGIFALQTGGEFLARFARSLAVLLSAGRPLPRALALLAAEGDAAEHAAEVRRLADRVSAGHALSDAMLDQPETFPRYLAETVRAGELSGRLGPVLERIADVLEMRQEARQRIHSSLAYPAMVLVVLASVAGFSMVYVLPKLVRIYQSHNAPLPPLTRWMAGLGGPFLAHPWLALSGLAAVVALLSMLLNTPLLAAARDSFQLRLPIYRAIHGQYLVGWTSAVTAVLLDGGVPVARALALAAGASENSVYARLVEDVQRQVESGESLAAALADSPAFPPDARQILAAGEEANCLERSFRSVARLYQDRLAGELKVFGAVLEPLAVLLLGALVAVFCMSVYAPLVHMGRVVSGT